MFGDKKKATKEEVANWIIEQVSQQIITLSEKEDIDTNSLVGIDLSDEKIKIDLDAYIKSCLTAIEKHANLKSNDIAEAVNSYFENAKKIHNLNKLGWAMDKIKYTDKPKYKIREIEKEKQYVPAEIQIWKDEDLGFGLINEKGQILVYNKELEDYSVIGFQKPENENNGKNFVLEKVRSIEAGHIYIKSEIPLLALNSEELVYWIGGGEFFSPMKIEAERVENELWEIKYGPKTKILEKEEDLKPLNKKTLNGKPTSLYR